uniref:Myosin motor domain-containing protein n=1 Tax=Mucochytrium quahogii TaxID=96639 RepID=A0A7S2S3H1_9STRA|mmetsp:Transcript_22676/g.36128  ORF Transcript_22676/g.36128 Transcript_22676/m.36128 type:complete len:1204 (+) Transcript_22676:335-3946(+)|eukprot:CAMPEP_0203758150 /NCGR_PEP_ID=MMETSP0098-20131031/10901_1 /ASSEMBLY_ACC=CAM_ASM_000208 /TAXON_ID=96639 /ORGANISM=" , Strain NY0313808BC1" /LENGTH=1203 /DNA_ID=CAMNT_0050650427 /DNA_START=356 /DNA_END=3967 /DNA_ORIENTATION=-
MNMYKIGCLVWVRGGENDDWVTASVVARSGGIVSLETSDKTVFQVDVQDMQVEVFPQNPKVEEDMTKLHHINEPCILHNIEERSYANEPYTFMGPVLVSVNPLKNIREASYHLGSSKAQSRAHPFAIAEIAFRQMQLGSKRHWKGSSSENMQSSQSIVIGGESGSGKTEASKRVVQHLIARCKNFRKDSCNLSSSLMELENRLLQVSPILETIGNASTTMNHNSSRFGKYTKAFFKPLGPDAEGWCLAGARIETYLLERSRVIFHGENERTFHILHHLVDACGTQHDETTGSTPLGLDQPKHFGYVGERCNASSAKAKLETFNTALGEIGFTSAMIDNYFCGLAGILHLGNVHLEGDFDSSHVSVPDSSTYDPLEWASRLLGVPKLELEKLFCQRNVYLPASKETVVKTVGVNEARNNRNAIAKLLYAGLFDWMLKKINQGLNMTNGDIDEDCSSFIGVLDIFGFESLQENSFEQLLINFTNEALQDTFVKQVFEAEVALYRSEGLVVSSEEFPRPTASAECMQLLMGGDGHDIGLLKLIDEVSKAPQPTDEKLNQGIHKRYQTNPCFQPPHPKDVRTTFIISHYPGTVKYTVGTFIQKNNDSLPGNASTIFEKTKNEVLFECFHQKIQQGGTKKGKRRGRRAKKATTIVSTFTKNIGRLVSTLESTKCSFIRCVKPNAAMSRNDSTRWLDRSFVSYQLRCLSIEQTAKVLKSGLPTRIPYSALVEAYGEALPQQALDTWHRLGGGNEREFTKALFWAFDVPGKSYRCGNTHAFFKSGQFSMLDRILDASRTWSNPNYSEDAQSQAERAWVVNQFKLYYVRMLWRKCIAKAITAKRFCDILAKVRSRSQAAITVTSFARMVPVRERYISMRVAAFAIRSMWRLCRSKRKRQFKIQNEELPNPKQLVQSFIREVDEDEETKDEVSSIATSSFKYKVPHGATSSLEQCTRAADRLFGISPKRISREAIDEYNRLVCGGIAWEVLARRLIQVSETNGQEVEADTKQTRAHIEHLEKRLEESEQRCWELKVVAAEREARITELTTNMMDAERYYRTREIKSKPVKSNQNTEDNTEVVSSMAKIILKQKEKIDHLTEEFSKARRRAEEEIGARQVMAKIFDELTIDLERERKQAIKNLTFFETRILESEKDILKKEKIISDYQTQLQKYKGMIASGSIKSEEDPNQFLYDFKTSVKPVMSNSTNSPVA